MSCEKPLPPGALLPHVGDCPSAQSWLILLANLGRAERTIDAYGRGLDQYLGFCASRNVDALVATLEDVSLFIRWQRGDACDGRTRIRGVANSTLLQRLTAIRLWYDHLVYQDIRQKSPVPRSTSYQRGGSVPVRVGIGKALVAKVEQLPRIPSDDNWQRITRIASTESLRNRVMFALAYFGALRREELVSLAVTDIDFARRLVTIRSCTTKTGYGRVVGYSDRAGANLTAYLRERHVLDRSPGALFLSVSNRNRGKPLSKWQWSKTIEGIARRAGVANFSTHTLRHLRLTHLARASWRLHEIAAYAGHRNPQSTMTYLHLSGNELTSKIARTMQRKDEAIDAELFAS